MSENTKATIEILEHYHHNGGFYEIPVKVINVVEQDLEEQDKEIKRLNNKLELISTIVEREFPPNEFITYKMKKILKGDDKNDKS